MANVKNFGLIGVGSDLQFGKAGTRLINNAGTFNFRNSGNSADAALTAAGITSSAGNVTLTTGNLVLSSNSGVVTLGDAGSISRAAAGVFQFSGTGAVIMPSGTTAQQTAATAGAFRYNNQTNRMEYADGTSWVQVASGGTAVTSVTGTADRITSTGGTTPVIDIAETYAGQTSITTLGTIGTGTWQGSVISPTYGGTGVNNGSSTITLGGNLTTSGANALTLTTTGATNVTLPTSGTLATTAQVSDVQSELDATQTSLGAGVNANGTFNGAAFTNAASGATSFTNAINLVAAAASGAVQSITITETGSGITITPGGTAEDPTFDFALDAGLEALATKTSTGILVQTGANTYDSRTLTAPAAGFTITNADGVSGNPTFALANDLAALEGLTTTGYIVRTADGAATTRSVTGTAGNISVSNGDGVASDTNIDLATVTDAGTGTFLKFTRDTYGRVSGTTAVVASDITGLVDSAYVNVGGDTMTGNLVMSSGATVTGIPTPTNASDAANKAYVDATAAGLTWKTAVKLATTGPGTLATDFEAGDTLDGVVLTAGDRILIKNQAAGEENGIYVVQASGAPVRSTDADTPAELDSAAVFVQQGTANADTGWVQTATIVTVGTTPQVWSQFSGSSTYVAGTGLLLTGNTFSVNLGAGITELPGDEVGIHLFSPSSGALILTNNGTTRGTASGDSLHLLLPAGSGLTQDSTGLYIPAAGVTNSMLVNDGVGLNADSGTSTLDLGQTLLVAGTSTQGINTSVSGQTVTITAANASDTQKGVASFGVSEFTVTSGNVVLATGGIANSKLTNSTITVTGTTGTDAVALGESLAIVGDSAAISTAMGANSLAISARLATTTLTGVASFSSTNFDVTAGAVSIKTGGVPNAALVNSTITLGTSTLTLGGTTTDVAGLTSLAVDNMSFDGNTISTTNSNGNLNLVPNGTGQVVIGAPGAGVIASDAGATLTVTGATGLTLGATAGDVTVSLANNTTDKVTISGPSAADYATGLADNDLVNKKYVDDVAAAGGAGDIKAVRATVNLNTATPQNIGAALPAGATILSVKVNVTSAAATGSLQVGKSGGSEYMTSTEVDTQSTGLYLAECMVTEAGSVQVQATVTGTPAAGSAVVVVTYQLA